MSAKQLVTQNEIDIAMEGQYRERAHRLMTEVPLLDGHNDIPYIIRGWYSNALNAPDFDLCKMPAAHTDLNRLREGRVGAQIWSAYVPSPACNKQNDFSSAEHYSALLQTLQQIDLILSLIDRYPGHLGFATSAAHVWETFHSGRIASLIGIEGLHQIANSASVLRILYGLGVRYATLTHSENNIFADSATASKAAHNGLSAKGRAMVSEMNRIGMIIDLSHTSADVQKQVLTQSRAPVIYSHSSCSAICLHPRNVTDECLQLVKRNGGLVMISFIPSLTHLESAEATVSHVAKHIVHVGGLIGYSHVGIGSDFDGIMNTVHGLEDVSMFPTLVVELLKHSLSDQEIRNILCANFLRVFAEVEEVAQQEKHRHEVMCDEIEPIFDAELKAKMWKNRVFNRADSKK